MNVIQNRRVPAYDSARFDADGFCVAHSDVRLSKLSDGKYKIVRKTCFKCGSASLARDVTSRGNRRKTVSSRDVPSEVVQSRGNRRKTTSCRVVPSEVPTTGDGRRIGTECRAKKTQCRKPLKSESRSSHDLAARTQYFLLPKSPQTSQNRPSPVSEIADGKVTDEKIKELMHLMPPPKKGTKDIPSGKVGQANGVNGSKNNKRSQTPGRKGGGRRIRRLSISLLSKSSSTSQNRRSSMSELAKKKVTNEKIKELMYLMPSPEASNADRPPGGGVPFDGNGYCRAHPEVRLAKKKPEGGGWEIVSGVCPQCCVSAVMACQQRRPSTENEQSNITVDMCLDDTAGLIGKVFMVRSDDSYETRLSEGSSLSLATPEAGPTPAFSADYRAAPDRHVLGPASELARSARSAQRAVTELNEACVSSMRLRTGTGRAERKEGPSASSKKQPPGRRASKL